MKKTLTIAGSDSSGCAGIQADIKTMGALGVFGMSVIAAVTSQNTLGVTYIEELSTKSIITQIEAIYDDLAPDALKSGMLFSKDIIEAVADILKARNKSPYVLDPVMVATSGAKLLKELEKDGLIIRKEYPQVPPKVEYYLSEMGKGVRPVVKAMYEWIEKYDIE